MIEVIIHRYCSLIQRVDIYTCRGLAYRGSSVKVAEGCVAILAGFSYRINTGSGYSFS